MRTEVLSRASRVVSLVDVARKIRDSAPAARAEDATTEITPVVLSDALSKRAMRAADGAIKGSHPTDPLLHTDMSRVVSICCAAIKRSGTLIEKALIEALQNSGFIVLPQVAMPISEAARNLIDLNSADVLRKVSVRHDAAATSKAIVYDMVVYDARRRTATLVEVKRGNGPTELRKIGPATRDLRAGALQLKSLLRSKGLGVRKVRAMVVDYYGRSGFSDDIRVTGDRLDHAFGCAVRPTIEAAIDIVRERIWKALPALIARALDALPHADTSSIIDVGDGIRVDARYASAIEPEPRRRSSERLRGGESKTATASKRDSIRLLAVTHGNGGTGLEPAKVPITIAAAS